MPRRFSSLWFRAALPFLIFVLAGSTAFTLWMQERSERDAERIFAGLAEKNAKFIHSASLPPTTKMAAYLSQILDLRVFFHHSSGFTPAVENLPHELLEQAMHKLGSVAASHNYEAVAHTIEPGEVLVLVRPRVEWLIADREILVVLGVFWLLTFLLGWMLVRDVLRPLQVLATSVRDLDRDVELALPGLHRKDELGTLAREIGRAHEELISERSKRAQAERLAILGKMTTGLAHEIYNPLSGIRMHAQLLASSGVKFLPSTATESLATILGEVEKIGGLVNQWMFLARPEPPSRSPVELGALLEGVLKAKRPLLEHAGVQAICTVIPAATVEVDSRRITQVLDNIIVNAIQAMPQGGELSIDTVCEESFVEIHVKDTGAGFSASALTRFDELFYSEKEGGMGIGLSVSNEILKAHDGLLHVCNLPSGGAKVSLRLPISIP